MEIANGGSISNVQNQQSSGAATGSRLDKSLGKDAFLKLLVAQLRNQNPLNPLQGTDFIAQTAQFTSLEQLQQINASLAELAASSTASSGGGSLDAVLASSYARL
jgi:flagellar basal-body rod modification protein FlgD